jgi:beta-lactam-binding protein with PASTA domain
MTRARNFSWTFVALILVCLAAFATGQRVFAQLQEPPNPHLLVASTTGSVGFDQVRTDVPAPVTRTLTLLNGGTTPLGVASVTIGGPNPADFAVISSTCGTMAPDGFCSLTLGFRPLANGARMAFLTIADNAGGTPHVIRLLGQGVDGALPQPAVGPIDPRYGYPISFSDGTTSVELCLYGPLCLSPVADQTQPPSVAEGRPVNFAPEAFWWSAEAQFTGVDNIDALIVMAQEAAFATEDPAPGDQWGFGRLRFRLDGNDAAIAGKWFRFTHPFGVDDVQADDRRVFDTTDIGCFSEPCDFSLALPGRTRITKFFGCASPAPPAGYLGDPNIECTITGAPSGNNFLRVQEITGRGGTVVRLIGETNLFAISAKLAAPVTAPQTTTVPGVVGQTQTAAAAAISASGLVVGTIATQSSATVPAGVVISQSPLGGAIVALGSAVSLVVSLGPPTVAVPNVAGMTQAAATTALNGAGLVVGAVASQNHPTVPAGSVISQNPAAGTLVAPGSAVAILISLGPALVTVPNVLNLPQATATSQIEAAGLVVGAVTFANSPTVLAGNVVSQNPAGGVGVSAGTAVNLVISLGPLTVDVPSVAGLTEAAASSAIVAAGLRVGTITRVNSLTVPAGIVISQNPLAGTPVAPNSLVALQVSLGPAPAGPAVHAAVNSAATGRGNRTVSITTTVPTRLVAFVSADGPQATGAAGQSSTVSGGGLAWTLVARANQQWGDAEIWTADAPAPLAAAAITSTLLRHRAGTDYIHIVRLVAFTGVSGIGASNVASGETLTTASVGLVAQAAGSVVYAVGEDWTAAVSRTPGAGQTRDFQVLGADADTFWFQRTTAPIAAAGAVNFTATTVTQPAPGNRWNFAIVELKR